MAACMQAKKLQGQLQAMKLGGKALWVSSPLSRAMQTMLLACPQPASLGQGAAAGGYRTCIRGYAQHGVVWQVHAHSMRCSFALQPEGDSAPSLLLERHTWRLRARDTPCTL